MDSPWLPQFNRIEAYSRMSEYGVGAYTHNFLENKHRIKKVAKWGSSSFMSTSPFVHFCKLGDVTWPELNVPFKRAISRACNYSTLNISCAGNYSSSSENYGRPFSYFEI